MPDENPPIDLETLDWTKPPPPNWASAPPEATWQRTQKLAQDRDAARQAATAAEAARVQAEAKIAEEAAKLTPLQQQLETLTKQIAEKDDRIVAVETGYTDPAKYQIANVRYEAYKATAGDKAVSKRDWLLGDGRADPILSLFHQQPASPLAPAATPKPAAPQINPPANEPTPMAELTTEQIAALRKANNGRLPKETLDALLKKGLTFGR